MKLEEIEPYLDTLRDWLLNNNFNKTSPTPSLIETYGIKFNHNKFLEIHIDMGNQYVWIRDKDANVVTVYNSDIQGNLTIEYLELLLQVIFYKNK